MQKPTIMIMTVVKLDGRRKTMKAACSGELMKRKEPAAGQGRRDQLKTIKL